eukprot:7877463-Alexandrium_andersonii.AAC.1
MSTAASGGMFLRSKTRSVVLCGIVWFGAISCVPWRSGALNSCRASPLACIQQHVANATLSGFGCGGRRVVAVRT